jgi:CHAT domain-containing protein
MQQRSRLAIFLFSLALCLWPGIARSQVVVPFTLQVAAPPGSPFPPAQLYRQGIAQYQLNQIDAALKSWQQALQQFRQLGDLAGEVATLGALSAGYIARGDYRQTILYAQQQLAISQELGDRAAQAQSLGNLGVAYKNLGDYPKALASHQQALGLFRELHDQQSAGRLLGNLGNTYVVIGDYEQAILAYEQSLAIARQIQNRHEEANVLSNLGAVYTNIGDDLQALALYQQSLEMAEFLADLPLQTSILINLGTTYHILKQSNLGIQSYQRGLALAQQIHDLALQGNVLSNLGLVYEDQQDYGKAIQAHQQSVAIAQASQDPRAEALARNNLAHALLAGQRLQESENQLRTAVKLLDQVRSELGDLEQVNIFDTQVSTYNLLQQVLIAKHNPEAALEAAEQGRARAFAQLLVNRLPQESDVSKSKFASILTTPTIAKIREIAQHQQTTIVSYSIIPDKIFKFRGKQRGRPAAIFIWVVQPTGKIYFRQVDLKPLWQQQKTLQKLVQDSRCLDVSYRCAGDFDADAVAYPGLKELYGLLIAPIADRLPKNPEAPVVFIPQDDLFLVPFAALQNAQGQFLVEAHTLLSAASIQVLDLTHQQHQRQQQSPSPALPPSAVVVGNPTMPTVTLAPGTPPLQLPALPNAEREAQKIAQLLGVVALIGDQATKAQVLQQLSHADFGHFATHGLLTYGAAPGTLQVPGAIALAPVSGDDGLLTASEVFNLTLKATLVVLSACDTGGGRITGDGVIGLSRAWIAAGVPSILVALVPIPDGPTADLMTAFYQDLKQTANAARSLRHAMLAVKKSHPEPINWATFILVGEAAVNF